MQQTTPPVFSKSLQQSFSYTMPEFSCSFRENHHSTNFLKMDRKEADIEVEMECFPKISHSISQLSPISSFGKKSQKWSMTASLERAFSIKSNFMKSVILSDESSFRKAFVFIKNLMKPHILAFVLTLLKIIIQNFINR